MADVKIDPKISALLLLDMQNEQVKGGAIPVEGLTPKEMISNCQKVLAKARDVGMPVVYVRAIRRPDLKDAPRPPLGETGHRIGTGGANLIEGSVNAEIISELTPTPEDFIVNKHTNNPFNHTDIEVYLRRLGVNTLLLTGHSTTGVVASVLRDAKDKDYDCVVISDCCAAWTPEEQDVCMNITFPRMAWVATTDEVIQAIRG